MPGTLCWCDSLREIIRSKVDSKVLDHHQTDVGAQLYMGFGMNELSNSVLRKGRTDFSAAYERDGNSLSPEELVDLYCYCNMKGHFFACMDTFQKASKTIEKLYSPNKSIFMVDVGCGPGTAGLALAEVFPNRCLNYTGIDSAKAMRNKAKVLLNAAKDAELIRAASDIQI
jgi:ribosomal protein RSM22 (predicted rRNA methylase)